MDKAVKERWIAALESGKYRKARNKLRNGNQFCCLGVLCDINGVKWEQDDAIGKNSAIRMSGLPPVSISRVAGLAITEEKHLAVLNDGNPGWSEVIQYIKDKL
jgi:hypothetical protein